MANSTVKITITADVMEAQAELKELQKQLQTLVSIQTDSLNKFDERTDAFKEHIRTSIDDVKKNIDSAIGKINELSGQEIGGGLSASIEKTESAFKKLGETIKTAFIYDAVFQSINMLEDAIKELAKHTLELDTTLETLGVGIAGQLSANMNFLGRSINGAADEQKNFQIATGKTDDIINKLRASSSLIGVPLNQLAEGFMASVGPATQAGMSIDQLTKFTSSMAAVAKASGIQMSNLGREIRDLIEGRKSLLTTEMGVNQAWINQHKAAGDLVEAYMQMAEKFDPMVKQMGNTWEGIKGRITNNIDTIIQYASKDIFGKLKEGGKEASDSLSSNMDKLKDRVRDAFDTIYDEAHSFYVSFKNIFEALKPAIDVAADAIYGWYLIFKLAFAGVSEILTVSSAGFKEFWEVIKTIASGLKITFSALAESMSKLSHGDFSGAKASWEKYKDDVSGIHQNLSNKVSKINDDMRTKIEETNKALTEQVQKIKDEDKKDDKNDKNDPTARNHKDDKEKHKKETGGASEMAKFEEELNLQKLAIEKNGNNMSLAEEASYWDKLISKTKEGTALHSEVIAKAQEAHKRIIDAANRDNLSPIQAMKKELEAEKENHAMSLAEEKAFWDKKMQLASGNEKLEEQIRSQIKPIDKEIDNERIAAAEATNKAIESKELDLVEQKKSFHDRMLAFGLLSEAEKIQRESDIAKETYDIKSRELDKELALYDGNVGKMKQIEQKKLDLKSHYAKEQERVTTDSIRREAQEYQKLAGIMSSSMATAFDNMILHNNSFAQSMQKMGLSILKSVTSMLTQMLAKWIVNGTARLAVENGFLSTSLASELGISSAKVATKTAEEATKTTVTATGAASRMATGAVEAGTSIAQGAASAWMWLLSAYSWAGYGAPILAAATVGVGIAGAYEMLSSATHSAEGGFDIPSGVNPVTQLHQNEMVLPAHIAQPLRDGLSKGGLKGGGDVHIHVSAMDNRSVKKFMIDNQDSLVAALKSANRNALK